MYSEEAVEVFLKDQSRLYDEPVAETPEEALEFLEDCMAIEVENIKEVRAYLDEAGADVSGMTDEDLEEACEVFTLPSGGYLIVEAENSKPKEKLRKYPCPAMKGWGYFLCLKDKMVEKHIYGKS